MEIFFKRSQGLTTEARLTTVMRMIAKDEELAFAAANGDADAFSALLERQYDNLFGLCFRLTGDHAEAEDLCQDICLALPAKLTSYKRQSKVMTWLYRVTVNAAHDRRRKQSKYVKATSGWGDWEVNRTATNTDAAQAANWLNRAMQGLKPELRDTLALILDDVSHADAGEILGVSEGTISWRISEAKKVLKAMKQEEDAT